MAQPQNNLILSKPFVLINREEEDNFIDPRKINEAFVRFKIAEFATFYFGIVGICCGVVEYEISYDDPDKKQKNR